MLSFTLLPQEEEMERGLGGTPLSPFAAATAVPPRDYRQAYLVSNAATCR